MVNVQLLVLVILDNVIIVVQIHHVVLITVLVLVILDSVVIIVSLILFVLQKGLVPVIVMGENVRSIVFLKHVHVILDVLGIPVMVIAVLQIHKVVVQFAQRIAEIHIVDVIQHVVNVIVI